MIFPKIMRYALLLFLLTAVLRTACADDLDQLVDPSITGEERGQVYARLASGPFPPIAAKLVLLIDRHPIIASVAQADKPWLDPNVNEDDRIACTLVKLWRAQIRSVKSPGQNMEILLDLLDDASLGEGRTWPARDVHTSLRVASRTKRDPAMPPLEMILRRLDHLAADAQQSVELRQRIAGILYEFGDPNRYLDLVIALSSVGKNPVERAEAILTCMGVNRSARLSAENRGKYVRHLVHLLEESKAEDVASGVAWMVARQLGEFVGAPPARPGLQPFLPDGTLPEYNDGRKDWMLDAVRNALKWWEEHKAEYQ